MPPIPFLWVIQSLRRLALWLLLAVLAVGLPLQALSSTLAYLLGTRHEHREALSNDRSDDPMAGWKDFRRADHGHGGDRLAVASGPAPSRASASVSEGEHQHQDDHAHGLRHRHAPDDASVADVEPQGEDEDAPAGSTHAGLFVVMAVDGARLTPPRCTAAGDTAWRRAVARCLADPFPHRIERPPRRA